MTHCAKCSAELIGTRKFCTACGTPAGDPRSPAGAPGTSPAASTGSVPAATGSGPGRSSPSIQYAPPPASQVNPFAQTAGPATKSPVAKSGASADYGPPPPPSMPMELATTTPGVGEPSKGPQVSPLATSNVDSGRGAFLDALQSVRGSRVPAAGSIPGTQMMPSVANPHLEPGAAAPGSAAPGKQGRTQVLSVFPAIPPSTTPSGGAPAQGLKPSSNPDGMPPQAAPVPAAQHAGPGVPLPGVSIPIASPHQGWNPAPYAAAAAAVSYAPPPQAPPACGYNYGFTPGSRVTVTWSNGQRYPGTVQQVSGGQYLVVFPDGQHHWVEAQYVAPG